MATSRLDALLLALLCGAAAGAQERTQLPIQVEARSSDFDYQNGVLVFDAITITQGQIRITADRAVASGLDFEESRWEFSGDVRIAMPEASLASDTARVRFSGGQIASATVTGAPATFEQQRKEERAEGRANRIDYDLQRGTVEFAGDAWLKDARTELTSATLVYSTVTQRVISEKPVVITIQPEDKSPEAPKPPS
jgi:lipopolysaccharide transport protein LptA